MEIEEFERKYINKVIHGNNLEVMKTFPNDCVDFIMTSSPYWSLRSYGKEAEMIWDGKEDCEHNWGKIITNVDNIRESKITKNTNVGTNRNPDIHTGSLIEQGFCTKCGAWKGELGLEPSFHDFVRHLLIITDEIKRILKPTGSFYLNIGDTYFGAHGSKKDDEFNHKETVTLDYEKRPNVVRKFDNFKYGGKEGLYSLRGQGSDNYNAKCMCGIPERVMLGMIDQGWVLRNKNIWYKPNSMPSSVRDRRNNTWEYIYHFVKSNKKQYWVNSKTMQLITQQPPTPSTGIEGVDWDWKEIDIYVQDDNKKQDMAGNRTYVGFNARWENKTDRKLKKVSNWRGWDYFYDLDSIRKPHQTPLILRPFGKKSDNKFINYRLPKSSDEIGNPAGKNPGDCFNPYQDGEYGHYHQGKDYHPLGKNPSDVVRNRNTDIDWIKSRGGNESGIRSLSGATYNYKHNGKNPGDFFSINTQPFPDAHFAVFPEAIVINPLKSSCPKEVCVKCGMPKVRIVKKGDLIFGDGHTKLSNRRVIDETGKSAWSGEGQRAERMIPGAFYKQKEVGYAQCNCNAGFKPGIAFDPFAGSGTTLLVAKKLGYRFLGIDIVKDYVIMAKKRLGINDYYVPNSLDNFMEKTCQIKPTQ